MGPLTVQFRQDLQGVWKAMEINQRTNGNTLPRFLLGQDDIGMAINTLLPGRAFPLHNPSLNGKDYLVSKTYRVELLEKPAINQLEQTSVTGRRVSGD